MLNIAIVDDQDMIRFGLRAILSAHAEFTVTLEASDGLAAVKLLTQQPADVVLMDIRMPGIDGVEATRRIRERWGPETMRIIILTTFEQDQTVLAALRAGANGFLSKAAGPAELIAAIEDVAAGGGALSPAAASALIERVADESTPLVDDAMVERFAGLTARERDVVAAIAAGQDLDAIAQRMFVSPYTVKTHINRAMAKVGVRDRAQLVAFAFRAGLHGDP